MLGGLTLGSSTHGSPCRTMSRESIARSDVSKSFNASRRNDIRLALSLSNLVSTQKTGCKFLEPCSRLTSSQLPIFKSQRLIWPRLRPVAVCCVHLAPTSELRTD